MGDYGQRIEVEEYFQQDEWELMCGLNELYGNLKKEVDENGYVALRRPEYNVKIGA